MAYTNTLIVIAPDSDAQGGLKPTTKRKKMPAHLIQFDLLTAAPYRYNHEELVFEVYVKQQGFSQAELHNRKSEVWAEFHQKGHPCMRASSLTKKFGWGAHYNEEGKIALYAVDSPEYERLLNDPAVKKISAMKAKR